MVAIQIGITFINGNEVELVYRGVNTPNCVQIWVHYQREIHQYSYRGPREEWKQAAHDCYEHAVTGQSLFRDGD